MTRRNHDTEHALAEDGLPRAEELDRWIVPEPSPDLTDRVMAAIAAEAATMAAAPNARASADTDPETVTMHATVTAPPARSLLSPIIIGVATAAAILGAFWLGRSTADTTEPTPVAVRTETGTPTVAAPEPVTIRPAPPAPPAPPAAMVTEDVDVTFDVKPVTTTVTIRDTEGDSVVVGTADTVTLPRSGGDFSVELRTLEGTESVVSLVLGSDRAQRFSANLHDGSRARVETTRSSLRSGTSRSPDLKDPFARGMAEGIATLRIGTNPGVPPADVWVDGKRIGKTPLPNIKVTPGRHRVELRWPGGKRVHRSITVAGGSSKVFKGG